MSKYYKLSAELLSLPLTPRAVLLYTILADRQELSRKTGDKYHDKDGYYIIYTITDICAVLGTGERTARYLLAELEDMKLISTRKQGKGLPQKIYVEEVEEVSDRQKSAGQERQKSAGQERQKSAGQERQKSAGLISYTDTSSTDTSSSAAATSAATSAATTSRIPELIAMIDKCAAELSLQIDDKARLKLLRKIQKHSKTIHALKPWLRAVMASGSWTTSIADDDDDSGKGYQPSYDIAEYESTSILDEDWDN